MENRTHKKADWHSVQKDGVVTLDNGHWVYGSQIKPLKGGGEK